MGSLGLDIKISEQPLGQLPQQPQPANNAICATNVEDVMDYRDGAFVFGGFGDGECTVKLWMAQQEVPFLRMAVDDDAVSIKGDCQKNLLQ